MQLLEGHTTRNKYRALIFFKVEKIVSSKLNWGKKFQKQDFITFRLRIRTFAKFMKKMTKSGDVQIAIPCDNSDHNAVFCFEAAYL